MKIKVIIFGATGMVGEGVLHEALKHPEVESVLVIGRRTCGIKNGKLTEIVHDDFFNYATIEHRLKGFDACLFCLGVSSIGMKEEDYKRLTYDLTLSAAETLSRHNPQMVFCYISGAGTDSTEKGKRMWARVKGKTENDLSKLPFKSVYAFRPGYIKPTKGLKNALTISKALAIFYPLMRLLFPAYVCTLEDLGNAMILASTKGYSSRILENKDIAELAQES
ncbi:MAG TPA: NAD-dependent epimerase/dehydratase family protein [Bacteroidota bacterium]|nr:NAD-dependent epimerase/dehydratase family protein [Bacteroidota bacterium]